MNANAQPWDVDSAELKEMLLPEAAFPLLPALSLLRLRCYFLKVTQMVLWRCCLPPDIRSSR